NLIMNTTAAVNGGLGTYWCPGGLSFGGTGFPMGGNTNSTVSGGEIACNTYGTLYYFATALSHNGMAPTIDQVPNSATVSSVAQGICPKGWIIPGVLDVRVMINKIAGDTDANASNALSSPNFLVNNLLKSTLSSKRTKTDSVFITATNPVWPWYGVGSKRQHGQRGTDYYGFSILPSVYQMGVTFAPDIAYYGLFRAVINTTAVGAYGGITYNSNVFISQESLALELGMPVRCVRALNLDQ
ncbi:MAG: hypothetical protein ACRC9X_01350, partial [Bacteroidales bacterium]